MSERLIIRNFGPIKDVELELKRFNILIGENGTGKSTIAKLLGVCRYFSFIVNFDYFERDDSSFSWGLVSWGLDESINSKSEIHYSCDDYIIQAKAIKSQYDPWVPNKVNASTYEMRVELTSKSARFGKLLSELKKINKNEERFSLSETPESFFSNKVAKVMNNPFYLPAERGLQSFFSLPKGSIEKISERLYNQLASVHRISNKFHKIQIEPLGIKYDFKNGEGWIQKKNEPSFSKLTLGATGFQSAVPIVLVILNYEFLKKQKTFIIEEPEQNLFPEIQNNLVRFLASKSFADSHNQMFLTTHSPYILTSLNNLLQAYLTGSKKKESALKVSNVIAKKYWVNPKEVSVYMLLPNGKCEDIFDYKENLIKSEKIDSVSTTLNEEFDKLLRIEFDTKKRKANA